MSVAEPWRSYATICRLCMQKDGFMLGIFNHIQGRDKSIYKKIIDCTALQIANGDGLPNVICHRCLYKLELCLEFRQQCFMSDATLRQINGVAGKELLGGMPPSNMQLLEHFIGGNDNDNVVMVVDPNALDYDSEYDSDNERQSDNENVDSNEPFECRNVVMCKFCDYAFTDKAECEEHEANSHDNKIPYACTDCSMNFSDRLQYTAHLKSVHQNDKPYNCPQCSRTFARRSDLRKHTVVHTGIKPFTCTICYKSFSRNTNLSKHMRIHSGQKPFVCMKCPKTFISKGDLTRHATIHSGQKPFNCSYCNLTFGRKDKLQRHEKKHVQEGTDQPISGGMFTEMMMLNEDSSIAENHSGDLNDDKQDEYNSENMVINLDPFSHNNYDEPNLQEEAVKHDPDATPTYPLDIDNNIADEDFPVPEHITGDEPKKDESPSNGTTKKNYACTICSKKFLTPDNLRYHQASHTGIRPFSCNICNRSFIRKRELDRHRSTHAGMRPFKCTKCPKTFGRKDKLVRHLRIHDTNKEFSCESCGALFSRKDALVQHMKTHIKDEEEESSPGKT